MGKRNAKISDTVRSMVRLLYLLFIILAKPTLVNAGRSAALATMTQGNVSQSIMHPPVAPLSEKDAQAMMMSALQVELNNCYASAGAGKPKQVARCLKTYNSGLAAVNTAVNELKKATNNFIITAQKTQLEELEQEANMAERIVRQSVLTKFTAPIIGLEQAFIASTTRVMTEATLGTGIEATKSVLKTIISGLFNSGRPIMYLMLLLGFMSMAFGVPISVVMSLFKLHVQIIRGSVNLTVDFIKLFNNEVLPIIKKIVMQPRSAQRSPRRSAQRSAQRSAPRSARRSSNGIRPTGMSPTPPRGGVTITNVTNVTNVPVVESIGRVEGRLRSAAERVARRANLIRRSAPRALPPPSSAN